MARGRKKNSGAKREVISIRITSDQKEILNKNPWIKKDLTKYIRDYLQAFIFNN